MTRKKTAVKPSPGPFPFTYDSFEEWYERAAAEFLDPSRQTFVRILNEALDHELSDLDRYRIRVSSSRVKDAVRLWNKLLRSKYAPSVTSLDVIPTVVDDLVGVRITCNNLSDLSTLQSILADLPFDEEQMSTGLSIEPDSECKYYENPKRSGYRAYHINLRTLIPAIDGWRPARGELQVRTLLQDSWGELTHEDTYKPGAEMPKIVNNLARRMADLLATVDDLAQDLRNELDALANEAVDERSLLGPIPTPAEQATAEAAAQTADRLSEEAGADIRDALVFETRRVVEALTKPATLAEIAQQVQANFGREVTFSWGGYKSFKNLLKSAVPDVNIHETPPGVVVPPGSSYTASQYKVPDQKLEADVPRLIVRLRGFDRSVPALGKARMGELMAILESTVSPELWNDLGISPTQIGLRELNALAKRGRDASAERGEPVARQMLEYVLKALYFSGNLRPGIERASMVDVLSAWLFSRAVKFGLVENADAEREELKNWIH